MLRRTYEFRRKDGLAVTVRVWRWQSWRKAKQQALKQILGPMRTFRIRERSGWGGWRSVPDQRGDTSDL